MSLSTFLGPIEWVVSWIMVQFHSVFTSLGMPEDGGWTWALSIVGLVVVIRILLIPLFVKQIRSQRGLQMLQPQIKELQKRYGNDRERLAQEQMKLYRETGTNPFASCLPILAQAPIFFALFRVLNGISGEPPTPRGVLTDELARQAGDATLFGAAIADKFIGAPNLATQVVAAVLIVLMSASMFVTQKQLMTKNMPAAALEGPFAQQQKIMLYLFPVIFLVTGVNFPIGVLIYWFTTNVWSLGQQLYVIARMPAPGSVAEARLAERRQARAARKGLPGEEGAGGPGGSAAAPVDGPAPGDAPVRGQRQQPRRQPKQKRSATTSRPKPPDGAPSRPGVGSAAGTSGEGSATGGHGPADAAGDGSTAAGTKARGSTARSKGANKVALDKGDTGGQRRSSSGGRRGGRAPRG